MNARCTRISWGLPGILFCIAAPLMAADKSEIDKLSRDLKADKSSVRAHAAAELARLGPEGAAAVPGLAEALHDESLAVRHEALSALERIGPAAREAVPELKDMLKSKDSRLYLSAANALGSIGRDANAAAPELADFLSAEDERISVPAAFALARILSVDTEEMKPVIPVLVKALRNKHRQIRDEAIRGLTFVGPNAITELAELVGDHERDPQAAVIAAGVLRGMGPAADRALPALIDAMKSKHDLMVTTAADAVGAIGPAAKDGLTELQRVLASEHPLLRTHAAHNIGRLGVEAAPATGDLDKALRDKDGNVRREAAQALGRIGPPAKAAVPALIAALGDDSQPVVLAAAHALSRLGREAVPALVPLVKDRRLGRWAVVILSEVGPDAAPAVDSLRAALARADEDFTQDIVVALGRIGPEASAAAPELIKIVEDQQHKLRVPAAFALGNIRAAAAAPVLTKVIQEEDEKESKLPLVAAGALMLIEEPQEGAHLKLALPKLIAALADKSAVIRREAAAALRQIGPPAASAAPALIQGLKDPNPAVCVSCLWALTAVAPEDAAPAIAPQIGALLSSPSPQVRYTACYAAGTLGPDANAVVPSLEKNLQDPDQFLQIASAWALMRIRPEKPEIVEECLDPLIRGLSLPDPRVRAEAATSLGLSGPAAQRAIPALTELTHDPEETVRKAATSALEVIHGVAKGNRKSASQPTRRLRSAR